MEIGVLTKFLVGGFCGESIVVVSELIFFCTLRFALGVRGGVSLGGAPKMHNILGLSQVGHLHLGR